MFIRLLSKNPITVFFPLVKFRQIDLRGFGNEYKYPEFYFAFQCLKNRLDFNAYFPSFRSAYFNKLIKKCFRSRNSAHNGTFECYKIPPTLILTIQPVTAQTFAGPLDELNFDYLFVLFFSFSKSFDAVLPTTPTAPTLRPSLNTKASIAILYNISLIFIDNF